MLKEPDFHTISLLKKKSNQRLVIKFMTLPIQVTGFKIQDGKYPASCSLYPVSKI